MKVRVSTTDAKWARAHGVTESTNVMADRQRTPTYSVVVEPTSWSFTTFGPKNAKMVRFDIPNPPRDLRMTLMVPASFIVDGES